MKNLVLTFLIIILTAYTGTRAQEHAPAVSTSVNPAEIMRGDHFFISLIIDYHTADDVTVVSPPFPPSLSIDRIAKNPRITETGAYTFVEYRIKSSSAGRFAIGPFTVITPAGVTETGIIIVNIIPDYEEQASRLMVWEDAPRRITAGDRITLALRVTSAAALPQPQFFMPQVPPGVILSSSPVSAQERSRGIALKLLLIPLESGVFNLPARSLVHGNIRYDIPALNIQVVDR
ncbi:MAG: hypothetical protein FWB83_05605 [Treponema sp.]|nr:hypothetical protein [Treponema sp.]